MASDAMGSDLSDTGETGGAHLGVAQERWGGPNWMSRMEEHQDLQPKLCLHFLSIPRSTRLLNDWKHTLTND